MVSCEFHRLLVRGVRLMQKVEIFRFFQNFRNARFFEKKLFLEMKGFEKRWKRQICKNKKFLVS